MEGETKRIRKGREEGTAAIGKSRKSETNGRVCREGEGEGRREKRRIKNEKESKEKKMATRSERETREEGRKEGRTLDGDDRDGYIRFFPLPLSRSGPKAWGPVKERTV